MSSDIELIKGILDHRNKKAAYSMHLNQSESTKKIKALNNTVNCKGDKDHSGVNKNSFNKRNELLSRKELMQQYIKHLIDNETKAMALDKNRREVCSKKSRSPLTSSCQSEKKRRRYGEPQYDYFNHKYSKYNLQALAYQIEKEFSKVNSNDESFNERLKFSVAKQKIKEEKINELVEMTKPHIEENRKISTFNRLIQDANRRIEVKQSLENINSDSLLMNAIHNNQKKRSSSVKTTKVEWEKIYQERFMTKLSEKNEKIRLKQQAIEQEKREEENEEAEAMRRQKKVVSKEELDAIAMRLHSQNYKRLLRNNSNHSVCYQTTPLGFGNSNTSSKTRLTKQVYQYQENCREKKKGLIRKNNQLGIESYNFNNNASTNYQTPVEKKEESLLLFNKAEQIINDFFMKQYEC